ncbi:MAG: hypothetical protein HZA50_04280 [Planctomycetes bacterium]|nr:hypothetical protein [Planctomycetota bacterium]
MRRIALLTLAIAGLGIFIGCPDKKTSDGGGSTSSGSSSSQPASQAATRSASSQPVAPVVVESATGRIDAAAGGAVKLSDGIRVEFPPGALAKACEVTVKRIDPKSLFRTRVSDRRIVLDVTCPEKLLKAAQVRLGLPKEAKARDADDIMVGHLGPGGVIEVSRGATIEMTPHGPELVAPADHFSVIVFTFAAGVLVKGAAILGEKIGSWIDPPPENVAPSSNRVPVYYQGESPECLATSAQMACKAVKPGVREIWRLMEESGISRAGLRPLGARFLGGFSAGIKAHSGVEPDIYLWQALLDATDTPYMGAMKRYIMRTLGEGIPVVFGSSEMKDANTGGPHAVILLGFDKDGNFYGINPQFTGSQADIVKITQKYMGVEMSMKGVFVTIALPAALDVQRPRVTLNVLPNSAWFLTDKGPAGPAYMLTWDGSCAGGIGWLAKSMLSSSKSGPVSASMPPDVTSLCIGYVADENNSASGGVEVCNADDRDHNVSVTLELHNTSKGTLVKIKGQDGLMADAAVAAHTRAGIPFLVTLGELFTPDVKDPQQFELRLGLFVEGTQMDTAVVPFTIDVLPTISTPFATQIKTSIPGHGIPVTMAVSGEIKGPQVPKAVQVKASDKGLAVYAPKFYEPTSVSVRVDYDVKMKYRIHSIFEIDKVNTDCQVDITLLNPRLAVYPRRKDMKMSESPAGQGKGVSTSFFMPFKDGVFGGSEWVVLAFDQKLEVSRPIVNSEGVVTRYEPYKTYTQELTLDVVSIIASSPKK